MKIVIVPCCMSVSLLAEEYDNALNDGEQSTQLVEENKPNGTTNKISAHKKVHTGCVVPEINDAETL